jgi:type VI secretion system protein ImpH
MATDVRRRLPDLVQRLVDKGYRYDFFQVVRMLERVWGKIGNREKTFEDKVRFRPSREIGFPAADIKRIIRNKENGRLDIQLNFMGLYGVDAPVPHYFIQTVLRNDDAGESTRAFLDIYSHRTYALLYLAWKKYRPAIDLEQKNSRFLRYFSALSGRDEFPETLSALRFAGLYGRRFRSATSLAGMVREIVNAPVTIREYVPRWVQMTAPLGLGSPDEPMVLGDNTVTGNKVLDVGGKVHITIGPVSYKKAQKLLPNHQYGKTLNKLVNQFLDNIIESDTTILVEGATGTAPALGDEGLRLGWRSWLGQATGGEYPINVSGVDIGDQIINKTSESGTSTKQQEAA